MLLVANLAKTKRCKRKTEKWLKHWHIGIHLRVYPVRAFQWIPPWQGLDGFQKRLRPCTSVGTSQPSSQQGVNSESFFPPTLTSALSQMLRTSENRWHPKLKKALTDCKTLHERFQLEMYFLLVFSKMFARQEIAKFSCVRCWPKILNLHHGTPNWKRH